MIIWIFRTCDAFNLKRKLNCNKKTFLKALIILFADSMGFLQSL